MHCDGRFWFPAVASTSYVKGHADITNVSRYDEHQSATKDQSGSLRRTPVRLEKSRSVERRRPTDRIVIRDVR